MTEVFPHVPGHPFPESCADPSHDGLRGQRTLNAQVAFIESLRPPRNSLGILCLPKSLMEYAVEDAWEGATEPLGDPADGIEIHNLSALADGIVSALVARLLSAGDKAEAPPKPKRERIDWKNVVVDEGDEAP